MSLTSMTPDIDSMADANEQGEVTCSRWEDTHSKKDHLGSPELYPQEQMILGLITMIAILLIGVVGNTFVILVVSKVRSMHSPTNSYLMSLAVADILFLLFGCLPTIAEYAGRTIDRVYVGSVGCAAMVFFQYLGVNVSVLSMTAFSVERYVAICHPFKAHMICTTARARKIIVGIWVFALCYCCAWWYLCVADSVVYYPYTRAVFHIGTNSSSSSPAYFDKNVLCVQDKNGNNFSVIIEERIEVQFCTYRLKRNHYIAIYMADLVIFYITPLLLIGILYGRMINVLLRNPPERQSTKYMSNVGSRMSVKEGPSKTGAGSRFQVVKMLVLVVVLFAVLWSPFRFMVVYNSFSPHKLESLWFRYIARTLVYINSAINPILYNLMSSKFRKSFRGVLECQLVGSLSGPTIIMSRDDAELQHLRMGKVESRSRNSTRVGT